MKTSSYWDRLGKPKVFHYPRYVYLIEVKNGKCYIGITSNVKQRITYHLTGWSNKKLKEDMCKYGYDVKVIDISNGKDEDIKEYVHINKAIDLGVELYNSYTCRKEYLEAVREVNNESHISN